MRVITILPIALLALGAAACETLEDGFTSTEWEVIESLSPLPDVPPDPTNMYADDPAAAILGQKFFFENRYSGPLTIGNDGYNGSLGTAGQMATVSCSACHMPSTAFVDTRSNPPNVSLGVKYTARHTPTLLNVAYYDYHGWGGKQNALWTQASLSPESGSNSAGNRCGYAHMVWDYYNAEYNSVFTGWPLPPQLDSQHPEATRFPPKCKPKKSESDPDGAWENMLEEDRESVNRIMANSGKAIAAYERLLVMRNAPFDNYVAGDRKAISPAAKRGLRVFIGRGFCVQCHKGPTFSDGNYYNIGVPQTGPHVPEIDKGRYSDIASALGHAFNSGSIYSDDPAAGQAELAGLEPQDSDLGAFRTPTLRNVALTAPYFHTGGAATLQDVIWHYDEGGASEGFTGTKHPRIRALGLTPQEQFDLVAFLLTLTGEPLTESLKEAP